MITDIEKLDTLAGDIAFEIVYGGDRFGPSDVTELLDGMPRQTMNDFKQRVFDRCFDMYPEGSPVFFETQISNWLGDVRTDATRQPLDVHFRNDLGRWFRNKNGQAVRCDRLLREASLGAESRAFPEILLKEVVKEKMDFLLKVCGHNEYGNPGHHMYEMKSLAYMSNGGYINSIETLPSEGMKGGDTYYLIVRLNDKTERLCLDSFDDKLCSLVLPALCKEERQFDESMNRIYEEEFSVGSSGVNFLDGPVISVPSYDTGIDRVKLVSVFRDADGRFLVEGIPVSASGIRVKSSSRPIYRLESLPDKSVVTIRSATEKAMNLLMKDIPTIALGKKDKSSLKV